MRIVLIGGPAAGKSTLTDAIVREFPEANTFGVRRYFARQIELDTELGRAAGNFVAEQSWIPDEVVARGVAHEIDAGNLGPSFVLEGMPGNATQARLLDELLEERDMPLDGVVLVDTPAEVCAARATTRTVCTRCDGGSHQAVADAEGRCVRCGTPVSRRTTDAPEAFLERLTEFSAINAALAEHYESSGRLIRLDGTLPPDVVADLALTALTGRPSSTIDTSGAAR